MKIKKTLYVSLGTIFVLSTIPVSAIASTSNENCIGRVTSTDVESFVDVDPTLNSLENNLKNKDLFVAYPIRIHLER